MQFPLSLVCIKGHHVNSIFDTEKKIDQTCPLKVYGNVNVQKEKIKFVFNLVVYIGPRVTDIGI